MGKVKKILIGSEEHGWKSIGQLGKVIWLIAFRNVLSLSKRKVMSYCYQRHCVLQELINNI